MNFAKKIAHNLKMLWYAFIHGMKNTEDATLHQTGLDGGVGVSVNQEVNENRVSKALLKGEITQQVKELRYRTYTIDREAKNFEYYTPLLALKRDENDSKFVKYDNSDGLELITIQPNREIPMSIYDMMETVNVDETQINNNEGELNINIGRLPHNHAHTISIERSGFTPRYRIEDYITMVTVKKDGDGAVLGLYVSIYPNDKDFKSKGFVREIEKLMKDWRKSDVIDIKKLSFVTNHAYRIQDMVKFEFINLKFRDVTEYDGHYIVNMKADFAVNGEDMTKEFYDESMAKKYETGAPRNDTYVLDTDVINRTRTYKCECCGKEVVYSIDDIDSLPMTEGREIDEDVQSTNVTGGFDLEVSEQTFGKRLCKECMAKQMAELVEKKANWINSEN